MGGTLFDNSTLTAVERLSGRIRVRNSYHIEGDLSAFENFISAILFSEDLYFIDDYKDEFRHSRNKFFNYLSPIQKTEFDYEGIEQSSNDFSRKFSVDIRGGQISSKEFKGFIEDIGLSLITQWNMRSSDWFLTLRLLLKEGQYEVDKYGPLMAALNTQTWDQNDSTLFENSDNYSLITSNGEDATHLTEIEGKTASVSDELLSFISSLNWLLLRSVFYTAASHSLNLRYSPHPIRGNFAIRMASQLFDLDANAARRISDLISERAGETIGEIRKVGEPWYVSKNIPLFSAWIASKTSSFDGIVPLAFEMRSNSLFRSIRERINEINGIHMLGRDKYLRELNKLSADLDKSLADLKASYGLNTGQGPALGLSVSLGWDGFSASLNADAPIRKLVRKAVDVLNPSPFSVLTRSITGDLSSFARIGRLRSVLTSKVRLAEDAHASSLPVDELRYVKAKPHWKRPM